MDAFPSVPVPLGLFMSAVFGLVFGSFVTALSYRLPRGESIAAGRSRCSSCGHELAARDLVPVLSWAVRKGACGYCGAKVSWRYPAIELVTALLFIGAAFFANDPIHLALLLIMSVVMAALAVIDMEHERLPNVLVALLAVAGLAWRWAGDGAVLMGLGTAVAVLAAGVLIDRAYKALRGRDGLGLGDAKLLAVGGLALPIGPFLLFLTLAGLFGVVFGAVWQRVACKPSFPFGPAILSALWISLAAGERILGLLISF